MNDEQQIEQQIQAKGLNAPRLTPDDIDAVLVGCDMQKAAVDDFEVVQ